MYPHRIRLRGPWECELPAGAASRRVNMPCRPSELGHGGTSGPMLCRRRFGYPGRIDAHERVWLTFSGVNGGADIRLNGLELGRGNGSFEFEVTSLLKERNVLEVMLQLEPESPVWDEVALEIRCTAFLRDSNEGTSHGPNPCDGDH